MVVLLLCALAGVVLAVVLAASVADPFGAVGVLHALGHDPVAQLLADIPVPETAAAFAAVIAGSLLPGLVCLLLAEALVAGTGMRRVAGLTLVVAAAGSYAVLPAGQATLLLVAALLAAGLLGMSTAILLAPVAFATGYLSGGYVCAVTRGDDTALAGYADQLDALVGLGVWWAIILGILALSPVAAAGLRLLRR